MEKNITPDIVISALASHTSAATSDFPMDVFPAKLQRIVLELHTSCGFPIDYTASAMRGYLCCNRKYPSCGSETQLA